MTYYLKTFLLLSAMTFLLTLSVWAGDTLSLDQAVERAISSNPQLASYQAQANSEAAAIRSQSWLADPRLGLGRQAGMNFMEVQQGPMNTWSLSEDFKFPTKYFLLASIQRARSHSATEVLFVKKLEIRRKVIVAYYDLFATRKSLVLLGAQRETLRQIARLAEARHATGSVPQQDEMKAHLEQTRLENDILVAQEEKEAQEATLNELLNQDASDELLLPEQDPPTPRLSVKAEEIPELAHHGARHVLHSKYMLEEARARQSLARSSYLPDFSVSYSQAFGSNATAGNYFFDVGLTLPIWFFVKQSGEVASASQKVVEAERNFESVMRATHSDVRALASKVRNHEKLLRIYRTSLIPQASGTLRSSQLSYQAGRTSFTDLLDSERSLYSIQIAYYQTLAQYVENLATLEESVGNSLSSLPFPSLGDAP